MTAGKLRVQKAREKRAEEEAAVEPEVELEEPEEEPAAVEPPKLSYVRRWSPKSGGQAFLRKIVQAGKEAAALEQAKIDKERAEEAEEREADEAEEKEKREKERREDDEVERLRVQQQVTACANGCVCVCAYGGSRKRDFFGHGVAVGESECFHIQCQFIGSV